ncbi:Sporulation protein YtfJ (Spore_YtfJ) [Hymenobacter gelipurpurascens]|uniref:Sporulation protein YtfJ (Spore_YtfJ) n=1 Tax=Hymenobacter gelipurpurascens TaxID=89968 RepID=A0A212TJ82_9BACT|nr:spore germination protein GerW family protein [Hymenobacter gelipurpurascens]SNC66043.1 Sporulation protein YtfJ (Spore_YtfJ) [Hymenobacter gelipurpurascens]
MHTPSTSAAATSLPERLAQQLGSSVSAQTIYGTPVERDGITIIPVARAIYGFGGGGGSKANEGEGSGGGAGVALTPIGYIELTDGKSRFRPIRSSVVPLVAVSGLVALLLLRSVPKVLRRNL